MEIIKILIVDDDENVLIAIRDSFTSLSLNDSCKLIFETNPENALKLIKNGFYDLIIVDYIFSGVPITGLEIFQEIKKVYRDRVYVGVLITSWGTTGLFVSEQAAGFFADYIEKPFNEFDNLKEKINKAIALLKRRQEADSSREKAAKAEPGK